MDSDLGRLIAGLGGCSAVGLRLGVTAAAVSFWLADGRIPDVRIRQLADAFGVDSDYVGSLNRPKLRSGPKLGRPQRKRNRERAAMDNASVSAVNQ